MVSPDMYFFCSFERPSAIQQRAIVPVVKGHDVIAQAQSGTGKTATFSISILQQVSPYISDVLSVCECMFRDLALQFYLQKRQVLASHR